MADACGSPAVDGGGFARAEPAVAVTSSPVEAVPAPSPRQDPADETLVPAAFVPGPVLPFVEGIAPPSAVVVGPPVRAEDGNETAVLGAFVPGPAVPFTPADAPKDADDGNGTMMTPAWTPT